MAARGGTSTLSAPPAGEGRSEPSAALRVAIISEHASPLGVLGGADGGGQNVYVAHLASGLARAGHLVDVYTRRDGPNLPPVVRSGPGCRVINVPAGPACYVRKEDLLPHMSDFTAWMASDWDRGWPRYDVVHANFWMSGLVACDLKRAYDVPVVVTFHALGQVRRRYQGTEDGFPDARFAVEERIIEEADGIIAQCPQDRLDLMTLYGADPRRLTAIPCGYDPVECHPVDRRAARDRLGLPADAPIVLQLGRLVPRKGVDDVVRAFALLQSGPLPEARLVIVGGESENPDPSLTPEIGRLMALAAAEGVGEAVIFAGRCDRARLADYYGAADVFATMPWYEPFGITPIEAMACGTPVVGARVGGIQHTVVDSETGFLVPARDVDALAERLLRVLQDGALGRRLGAAGIERARTRFTWQHVVDRFERLFVEIAQPRAPRRQRDVRPDGLDDPRRDPLLDGRAVAGSYPMIWAR